MNINPNYNQPPPPPTTTTVQSGGVWGPINNNYPSIVPNHMYSNMAPSLVYANPHPHPLNANANTNGYTNIQPNNYQNLDSNQNYPYYPNNTQQNTNHYRNDYSRYNYRYNNQYIPNRTFYRSSNQNYFNRPNYNQQNFYRRWNRNDKNQNQNRYPNNNRRPRNLQRQPQTTRNQSTERSGPRTIKLNDFMPPSLRRDPSQDLPDNFNVDVDQISLISAATTRPTTPVEGLPQRRNLNRVTTAPATTEINETQPFEPVQQTENITVRPNYRRNQQNTNRKATTTSSNRRRQRRQQQNNRFDVLIDENVDTIDQTEPFVSSSNIAKKSKKQHVYLEHNRLTKFLNENSVNGMTSRGNQAYAVATAPIYDDWVRNNYQLQVWQYYLKIGTDKTKPHWAKEVVQRTKTRENRKCTIFVQKKINQLKQAIAQFAATISDLQIQLNTYWFQNPTLNNPTTATINIDNAATATTVTNTSNTGTTTAARSREAIDRIEKSILKYISHCTGHVKKNAENKIKIAKAEFEEYKSLEDFQLLASPLQAAIHLTLKPKMKLWMTKKKNVQIATKRVQYDMPPKFIENINFSFKIDESILASDEAQTMYDRMRDMTKRFRLEAMTAYLESSNRELELLEAEIGRITEEFPSENTTDNPTSQASVSAFKHYHELRKRRMILEIEQSSYFLEEERVDGFRNNPEEEILAPTLTRSLGEDFLLQA